LEQRVLMPVKAATCFSTELVGQTVAEAAMGGPTRGPALGTLDGDPRHFLLVRLAILLVAGDAQEFALCPAKWADRGKSG
jgi:hypothetical protein